MIRCAICDDEIAVTDRLLSFLDIYGKQRQLKFDCRSFQNPLLLNATLTQKEVFDLYILDILMPDLTGIALAREIRKVDTKAVIIFLSSSDEYHRDAFGVEAIQYLSKPVRDTEFMRTLDRAVNFLGKGETQTLPVQTKSGIRILSFQQIVCVSSFRHVLTFYLADGSSLETLDSSLSLVKLSELLCFPPFFTPCRGFIVNVSHVEYLERYHFVMRGGVDIPIPQKQFSNVSRQYSDYLLKKYHEAGV